MNKRKGEREKERKGENASDEEFPAEISDSETKKISLSPLLPFSLSLLHLLIALPVAYILNIWVDEASSLYTTGNGLVQAFQNVFADEQQAPLYFLLLSIWRELNHSIFFARLFSIVFSVLAIWVFYRLARKLFDEKAAFFITAVFAFHPFLIWASLEIRVYSLVVLLSGLLLKLFLDAYLSGEDISGEGAKTPGRTQIFYVLTAIVGLYTNYYLGFLLVGNFCALVVLRKWRAAKNYFLQMIAVGVSILPLLWAIKSELAAHPGRFHSEKSLLVGLQMLWNHFLTFVLPTEIFPPEETTNISFVRIWLVRLLILAVVVWLVKRRKIFDKNILAFGTICAVIFFFLLSAYFLLGEIFVEIRHAAVLFVPLILFAALVLREIFPPARQDPERTEREKGRKGERGKNWSGLSSLSLIFLTVLIVVFFAYSLATLYPNFTKRGDWARVGAFIESREKPNQPIIVFTAFDAICLPYNYKGANKILPDEKFFDWEFESEAGSADSWRRQTEFIISEIPAQAEEIWLLTNDKCAVKDACRPLENFVEANYTIIEEMDFYKEKVRLLRKK